MTRIEKACVDKGLRMTDQRRVIARVLSDAADHPDAEELYRRASSIDPHISIATVYRTVKLFEDAGILERHDFRDGRSRYEEVPENHHDHLIDVQTGQRWQDPSDFDPQLALLSVTEVEPGRLRVRFSERPCCAAISGTETPRLRRLTILCSRLAFSARVALGVPDDPPNERDYATEFRQNRTSGFRSLS